MATIDRILEKKGSQVFSISPSANALDAALLMNEHRIGALIVIHEGHAAGIFTERDMLRRVVARQLDPAATAVGDVMTGNMICVQPDTSVDEARKICQSQRIRHLPVIDEKGNVKGLISLGDLNAWRLSGQEATIHYLQEYLYGNA